MDGQMRLDPTDEGYLLTRTMPDGTATTMPLSNAEVLTLAQSAVSLRATVMSSIQPKGTGATAIVAAPLGQFRVEWDSLGESILLEMLTPAGGQVIYSVEPMTARLLAERLNLRPDEPQGPLDAQ